MAGRVLVAQRPWLESWARRRPGPDPVDPEGTPVVSVNVPRKQVPAAAPHHESLRLDRPYGLVAIVVDVIEAQPLAGSDRTRNRAQHCRVHGWPGSGDADGCGPHCVDSMAQPRWQQLLELDERS